MATIQEAMRKALAKKRAEVIAARGKPKLSVGDAGEADETVVLKYVRCTRCEEMASYNDFLYHGTRLPSCKCKGGQEDYVTFDLEVTKGEEELP